MKKIVLILVVILIVSCKKKEVAPIVQEPVCETTNPKFVGKYKYMQGNQDTIEIIFISNNCPNKVINTYVVKGLGKAVQPILNTGQSFSNNDYTIKIDETIQSGSYQDGSFSLSLESNGLTLNCNKLQYQTTKFQKI